MTDAEIEGHWARMRQTGQLKVLSLWEPWATFMSLRMKKIETRSWQTSYRGPILIHAAKRWTEDEKAFLDRANGAFQTNVEPHCGHALSVGILIDCLPGNEVFNKYPGLLTIQEAAFGNYDTTAGMRYGWVFHDMRQLKEPLPMSGSQGLRVCELGSELVFKGEREK